MWAHQSGRVTQAEVVFVLLALLLMPLDPAEMVDCSYLFHLLAKDIVGPGLGSSRSPTFVTTHNQHQ